MSDCTSTKVVDFATGPDRIECNLDAGHDGPHVDPVSEVWWR